MDTLIEDIKRRVAKQCAVLESLSEEYTADFWEKEMIIEDCRKRLEALKEKAHQQLDRVFEDIERSLSLRVGQFHDQVRSEYEVVESKIHHCYQAATKKLKVLEGG